MNKVMNMLAIATIVLSGALFTVAEEPGAAAPGVPTAPTTQPARKPLARGETYVIDAEVVSVAEHAFVIRFPELGDMKKNIEMTIDADANTKLQFATLKTERIVKGRAIKSIKVLGQASWKDLKTGSRVMVPLPEGASPVEGGKSLAAEVNIMNPPQTSQATTQPSR